MIGWHAHADGTEHGVDPDTCHVCGNVTMGRPCQWHPDIAQHSHTTYGPDENGQCDGTGPVDTWEDNVASG